MTLKRWIVVTLGLIVAGTSILWALTQVGWIVWVDVGAKKPRFHTAPPPRLMALAKLKFPEIQGENPVPVQALPSTLKSVAAVFPSAQAFHLAFAGGRQGYRISARGKAEKTGGFADFIARIEASAPGSQRVFQAVSPNFVIHEFRAPGLECRLTATILDSEGNAELSMLCGI